MQDWRSILGRLDPNRVPGFAARAFAARPSSVRPVGFGVNAVFRMETPAGVRYLRMVHAELRGRTEVAAALAYHRHAAARGARVCEPVASEAGRWIEEWVQGPDRFLATAVAEAPGRCVGEVERTEHVYASWGRALGSLHRAVSDFRPASLEPFPAIEATWAEVRERLPADDRRAHACREELDAWVRGLPRDARDRGLTHGDFRAGNAIWDGERVRIIDFDEPTESWWIADVARAFMEGDEGTPARRRALLDAFVEGYRAERSLSPYWLGQLAGFLRMKALQCYAWTIACWSGERVPGGQPRAEALASLRAAFLGPLPF